MIPTQSLENSPRRIVPRGISGNDFPKETLAFDLDEYDLPDVLLEFIICR